MDEDTIFKSIRKAYAPLGNALGKLGFQIFYKEDLLMYYAI